MAGNNYTDSNIKKGYYGYRSESVKGPNQTKAPKNNPGNSAKATRINIILFVLQLIVSIAFIGLLIYKNISFLTIYGIPLLPVSIVIVLIFLALAVFFARGSKNLKITGRVISIFIIVVLLILIYIIAPWQRFSGKKMSTDPFVVFVSANDTFGELNDETIGRSDTNIIAVVNPKTHSVLMISTPRDYYVPIVAQGVAEGSLDKLTHVGLYGNGIPYNSEGQNLTASDWNWGYEVKWRPGCDALMDTLQSLYKFDIPEDRYHYVKLNFTGFADLIDALGGVTIKVDEPFTSKTYATYGQEDNGERKTYVFKKGKMEMDGDTALTFARERHSFATGDLQRNKNQVKVLDAIADKLLSGTTLLHYNDIVEAIQNSFTTDIDISSMVSLQTQVSTDDDYDGWKIMSYSVTGTNAPTYQTCTYTGTNLSVVLMDDESIGNATNLINMTLQGKTSEEIKKQIKKYERSK